MHHEPALAAHTRSGPTRTIRSTDGDAEAIVPEQLIDLTVSVREQAVVVSVSGEIDMLTAPTLRSCLEHQLKQRPQLIVVDLSSISFLGSSGLAVLVAMQRRAGETGTTLRLVCSTRAVLRPLQATGLDEVFQVSGTLEEALTEKGGSAAVTV